MKRSSSRPPFAPIALVATLALAPACSGGDGTGSPGGSNGGSSGSSRVAGSSSGGSSGSGASTSSGSGSSGAAGSGAGSSSASSSGTGSGGGSGSGSSSGSTSGSGSGGTTPSPYDCNWGPPVITSLAPSTSPPGGLALNNVPQFVALGFDDNRWEEGLEWALDFIKSRTNPAGRGDHCTFDGTPARVSFFVTSQVTSTRDTLKALHARAYQDGNEVGNHTDTHATTLQLNPDLNTWLQEMSTCNTYLTGLGIPKAEIAGFRTPFLAYSSATFTAIAQEGFAYDCSIEHFLSATGEDWPYTLDNGASKNTYTGNVAGSHAGMWELPVHEFMPSTGWVGITGLDYNIWCVHMMNPADALNLLKASLDIRFKGDTRAPANRAPLFVGGHTDLYSPSNPDQATCANTVDQRRQVIEQFIDYALGYDPAVRLVPYGEILHWMQHPVGLDGTKGR